MNDTEAVCVLGAGTMGRGIAHACAVGGHRVRLRDVNGDVLAEAAKAVRRTLDGGVERGKLSRDEADAAFERLETTTDLATAAADADVAIEAVPEDIDLKRDVLAEVESHLSRDALVGSNTSSLPLTSVAAALDRPGRAVGLHFFNPVHAMDLVEVVLAEQTTDTTRERAESLVEGLGKTAVTVADSPGFATSRLGAIQGVEAIRMLQEGVAGPRDVDAGMELGYRHPMGPIELTDVVGLDVRLDILEHLREELGERFAPPPLLRRKVRAGKLGRKTGEGFYVWEDGEIAGVSGSDDPAAEGEGR
ncbi:3-hydroxybutyryl-CoA dehydrogenase [Halorarum halophilum]|uniref:3-hydroxybutyryl-CoA dehydrogenase n=1 Tax=Halorarum halophilum TaxID=2743090 RepID=A0A7D5GAR4_9EURY|nr:3-hydroxyacyl-CoA dehydrogenase NAD-binding domain-containing protein [Halobaculum halophilum]QLG26746.1 3-hydroxybutyryl-CoA dehydrogenase [Halobaculum halophilum]